MGFFSKLMGGSHSEKELKNLRTRAEAIYKRGEELQSLSDEALAAKTEEFKKQLHEEGKTLDDILPEAFAVASEAAYRQLQMRPFVEQIMGGIVLHQGRIAEMKTGEGKTLVAVLPAYLNALEGKGVHIVTVNDYLAERDANWMGAVHRSLGLSVGVILNSMKASERQEAYACDITYGTNNEFGFDYLRDNLVKQEENLVERDLHYAIIDEVDSVLIDEARTPLIISGPGDKSTEEYRVCDMIVKRLERGEREGEIDRMSVMTGVEVKETGDYIVNEKEKHVVLTEQGVAKVERMLGIKNLADPENLEKQHIINLALRANNLMHKDKDYVVRDKVDENGNVTGQEVMIVDEFTGRIMPGRRYSDGLHQAIEAKEGVEVRRESMTLATITIQNYFNKYEKTAGMTGTAKTEEGEFQDIYGLDVVEIPTHKPVRRIDHNDAVYFSHEEKIAAIVEDIRETHAKGQPVLVGTISIEASEELSKRLEKEGLRNHNVLNAKFHEREAEIVAEAGEWGAITIATNMAGRGTDIKLGEGVEEIGGLKIIGTERHEARRIDNQLRGRSGRQGDRGESIFYLSLEDNLLKLYGADRAMGILKAIPHDYGMALQHKMLDNTIERAQKKLESNNFAIRKNLLDYDQVINEQRELIYGERRRILKGEDVHEEIIDMIDEAIEDTVNSVITEEQTPDTWDIKRVLSRVMGSTRKDEKGEMLAEDNLGIPIEPLPLKATAYEGWTRDQLSQEIQARANKVYNSMKEMVNTVMQEKEPDFFAKVEREQLLTVIDAKWRSHVDDMDQLKQGVMLQAYGQKDPVVEYRYAGEEMFDEMTSSVRRDVAKSMFTVFQRQPAQQPAPPAVAPPIARPAPAAAAPAELPEEMQVKINRRMTEKKPSDRKSIYETTCTNRDSGPAQKKTVKRQNKKIQPNDPCPCGKTYPDGKPVKYKNCCGRNR